MTLDLSQLDNWSTAKDILSCKDKDTQLRLLLGILLKTNDAVELEDYLSSPEYRQHPLLLGTLSYSRSNLFSLIIFELFGGLNYVTTLTPPLIVLLQ